MDHPLFQLLFNPFLPHTINGVAVMFYAVIAVCVAGAIMEHKR